MDNLKKIKMSHYIPPNITYDNNGDYYYASEVDALIAEMQAEIDADKEFRQIQWELDREHDKVMKRLQAQNAALMEVLEASNQLLSSDFVYGEQDKLEEAIEKARKVINGNSNDK